MISESSVRGDVPGWQVALVKNPTPGSRRSNVTVPVHDIVFDVWTRALSAEPGTALVGMALPGQVQGEDVLLFEGHVEAVAYLSEFSDLRSAQLREAWVREMLLAPELS
jgi:hypothetical protein